MKNILILSGLLLPIGMWAQTAVNKSIPVKSGQTISMKFDYPELIRVSTWDKNEISIQGEVNINNGENDDAFELSTSNTGNTVYVENRISNLKDLPQTITIKDGSQKVIFKSRDEYRKYKNENGERYDRVSWGVDIDITLEIKVPKNTETSIVSVYGTVEVKDFSAPLSVVAKYGSVDVALNEKSVGELSAETNYGQIYSNLDIKFDSDRFREKDFYTFVTAKPGSGPRYDFEAKYGNVYLRKSK
ncbi:MAG: hypothetical protein RIA63_07200 [Cyclobacteriaceae bacterium]